MTWLDNAIDAPYSESECWVHWISAQRQTGLHYHTLASILTSIKDVGKLMYVLRKHDNRQLVIAHSEILVTSMKDEGKLMYVLRKHDNGQLVIAHSEMLCLWWTWSLLVDTLCIYMLLTAFDVCVKHAACRFQTGQTFQKTTENLFHRCLQLFISLLPLWHESVNLMVEGAKSNITLTVWSTLFVRVTLYISHQSPTNRTSLWQTIQHIVVKV